MIERVKYIKIVKWSDDDQCYIGYCPGVIGPCCHGDDEVEVYRELCEIVDEWIKIARQENESLPPPTIGLEIEELLRSAWS
jgi:predicted RNase H-like HicB family nuclease